MNNETLNTDLCARLPYWVLVETTKWQNNGQGKPMTKAVGKLIGYSDRTGYEVIFNEDDFADDFDDVKPILFPISCLTQEITVNGDTFVPIVELTKQKQRLYGNDFTGEYKHFGNHEYSGCQIDGNTILVLEFNNIDREMFFITELLNKWHINYRLSLDQFIEATNEYA